MAGGAGFLAPVGDDTATATKKEVTVRTKGGEEEGFVQEGYLCSDHYQCLLL